MESHERQRIVELASNDFDLKRLYSAHEDYEERLEKLSKKVYLTSDEEFEKKKLKIRKLRGKERMLNKIAAAA